MQWEYPLKSPSIRMRGKAFWNGRRGQSDGSGCVSSSFLVVPGDASGRSILGKLFMLKFVGMSLCGQAGASHLDYQF